MRAVLPPSTIRFCGRLILLAIGLILCALALSAQAAEPDTSAPAAPPTMEQVRALERAHDAVVGIHASAVDGATTSAGLGQERLGSGVVIGPEGLVLTIGYLILEADHVDLVLHGGRQLPARVVAYDQATGFGLLQALAPLDAEPAPLGNSAATTTAEPLLVASGFGGGILSVAQLVSRRGYSGYWEYRIEDALFTAPPRPDHSGAGLFNAAGELIGIGSLIVADALGPGQPPLQGNMFVPIDLLKPILGELRAHGASAASRRPWLGVNCVEHEGRIWVLRLVSAGPAEASGLRPGDQIAAIDGVTVSDLASFYRALWKGDPGKDVLLAIVRAGAAQTLTVHTRDRSETLRRPRGV
jgi:S1-C subfamily serine protease